MEIEIKGKKIDLSSVLPLKLKDWRYLEKKGVNIAKIGDSPIESQFKIVSYVISKVDSSITHDDIDDLGLNDPAIVAIMGAVNTHNDIDRPTLPPSTS